MQLEQTINRRMSLYKRGQLGRGTWRTEEESLAALASAADELVLPRLEEPNASTDELQELEKAAQDSFCVALRKLQRIYTACSNGVFSTTAAASGPFVKSFRPHAIVMDEGWQMGEAKAVSAIVHGLRGQRLRRVLIIGDPAQGPPTLAAPRNAASANGRVSLIERLIAAGVQPVRL